MAENYPMRTYAANKDVHKSLHFIASFMNTQNEIKRTN